MNAAFVFRANNMTSQSLVKAHWPSSSAGCPTSDEERSQFSKEAGKPGCLTPRSGEPALWQGPDKDDRTAHGSAGQECCSFRESKIAEVSFSKETQDSRLVRPDGDCLEAAT